LREDVDRLRENDVVTVNLPSSGALFRVADFDATVIALVESGAALDPLDISTALLPARADDVFLSFVHGGQLVGLKGTLSWNGHRLRFQVADGVHMRRNRYTRVDAELPVTLRRGDDASEGVTVNVAPEGLLVKAPPAVELGDVVELGLTLPGQPHPLPLRGEVVRHAGALIALHLADTRHELRAVLAEFVVERRAAQLHAAVS
jgi:hypothetical protein